MFLFFVAVSIQVLILIGVAFAIKELRSARYNLAKLRDQSVDVLGNFLADVLEHPRVKIALAQSVANGMNHTIEQPDLGLRLQKVSDAMLEDNIRMSRVIGEQLPGLAASFVGGAMSSLSMIKMKKRISKSHSDNSKEQGALEVTTLSLDSSESVLDTKKDK